MLTERSHFFRAESFTFPSPGSGTVYSPRKSPPGRDRAWRQIQSSFSISSHENCQFGVRRRRRRRRFGRFGFR